MQLPNLDQAFVPEAKITEYLLDIEHEDGRGKALFFIHFGFSETEWETLAQALLDHAYAHQVAKQEVTPFGMRYIIEGALQTPIQRTPLVRVVWFIPEDEIAPRLVTAYPLEK
jgi:hypothetical protein